MYVLPITSLQQGADTWKCIRWTPITLFYCSVKLQNVQLKMVCARIACDFHKFCTDFFQYEKIRSLIFISYRFISPRMSLLFRNRFSQLSVSKRLFSTGSILRNEAKSSCQAGTVLNLKIRKAGDEPVALEDKEYPEWLWDCLDKSKLDNQLKEADFMKWRRRQLNKENTKKINNNNFLSQL